MRPCKLWMTLLVLGAVLALAAPRAALAQDGGGSSPALAGPSDAELGEAAPVVRGLKGLKDKTLVFVFDVSGSMRGELLRRARTAAVSILREGAQPGDRVVLYTFGAASEKVFDERLASNAQKRALIDKIPSAPGEGAGTNIRRPHHEALKILEAELPKPGAVILLTDSFNDEPKKDDPAYADYLRYYTPGGRLEKYPDTPENRDYERLLAKLSRSDRVQAFGIGVQIDQSGRPMERLPQAAPSPASANEPRAASTPRPLSAPVSQTAEKGLPWPLIAAIALGAAALAGLLFFLGGSKPVPLRVTGGPGGAKEFQVKAGQPVKLGGDGANFAQDAYPLPDVKSAPAAIKAGRGGMSIAPLPPAATAAAPGGEAAATVLHNGLPLEREMPLRYGDEVRVMLPRATAGAGIGKEFRLKFEDPTEKF